MRHSDTAGQRASPRKCVLLVTRGSAAEAHKRGRRSPREDWKQREPELLSSWVNWKPCLANLITGGRIFRNMLRTDGEPQGGRNAPPPSTNPCLCNALISEWTCWIFIRMARKTGMSMAGLGQREGPRRTVCSPERGQQERCHHQGIQPAPWAGRGWSAQQTREGRKRYQWAGWPQTPEGRREKLRAELALIRGRSPGRLGGSQGSPVTSAHPSHVILQQRLEPHAK